MDQNSSNTQTLAYKWDFLQKYGAISKIIKPNVSCYAISYEWWSNFECLIDIAQMEHDYPLGNPGPINNLPILNLGKLYEELINIKGEGGYSGCPDAIVLSEMNDWDNMTLKSNMKYGKDFIIVSAFLWKFLHEKFGGGPEIELLPETKPEILKHSPNVITSDEETLFERTMIINLDMMKIYVSKDHDFASSRAKYVSPTITVQTLLNCLCKDDYFPPHNTSLYWKIQDYEPVELSNKKATLKDLGIQEESFLTLSRTTDPMFGFPSAFRNAESIDRDDMDSNKANEDGERSLGHQFSRNSDFEDLTGVNDANNRIDVEMDEFQSGGQNSKKINAVDSKEQQPHPMLEVFVQRSKQAVEKEKIKLEFKSLKEIKASMTQIQQEWDLWTKNNTQKKA